MGISRFSKGQAEILDAIPRAINENKPIIVPSGNSQGKDWLSSSISLWFAYNYYPSKVIITAPTDRQVKEIMWAEIQSRWNNAQVPLPGRLLTCKIDIEPEWFVLGFTTKETGEKTGKAQGFHSRNICVIASEAQAIDDPIFEQLDSILNAEVNLFIMIGNPLRTSGKFARAIKNTTDNIVINLDCLDSPNYRYKSNVIPGMASYDWIEKKRKEWDPEGTNEHPLWRARVRGLLPKSSIDTIFSQELIDKGVKQQPKWTIRKITTSCDPARMGDDECVIMGGMSGKIIKKDIIAQSTADTVCSRVLQMTKETESNYIIIEADGLGGPICDFVRKLKPSSITLHEVYMSGKAEDEDQFANKRAEIYFHAKKEVEEGREQIPEDEYLQQEIGEIKYFFNTRGRIQLESKDDVKERLGRSPDRADAWVLNVYARKFSKPIYKKSTYEDYNISEEVSSATKSAMAA